MPSNSACFNSQPPEGGWYSDDGAPIEVVAFQLTAARRRLGDRNRAASQVQVFQLTAARRRLVFLKRFFAVILKVSTHSRPKAAGADIAPDIVTAVVSTHSRPKAAGNMLKDLGKTNDDSTHSRPKAAGI